MRTSKYLDEVMRAKSLKRDKELAEWLGVSAPAIAQYRSGARTMDNEKCVKIALELNIDPLKIIMASDLDKAERSGQKSLWEVFTMRTVTTANTALLLLLVNLFLTPTPAEAAPALNVNNGIFILCKITFKTKEIRKEDCEEKLNLLAFTS
ncbi:hypothetical protein BH11PSE12_BH11PSE12_17220 [soil metagenome]